jgi:hypothetical protein
MAATYKLIASQTLGTNAANVTFNSIPSTYTDLVLRVSGRDTYTNTADAILYLQINSSSTQAYSDTVLYANHSNVNSYRNTIPNNTGTENYGTSAASATANAFGSLEIYIPNYAGSTKKMFYSFGTPETIGRTLTFGMGISASLSSITDPITQLVVKPSVNFVAGSTFYLYGVEAKVNPAAKATGGTISYGVDGYTYHAFTDSGTFTPTSAITADILVIAGGGAGGSTATSPNAAGGGAGGVVYAASQSLASGVAKTVTVGAGGAAMSAVSGAGPTTSAANGSNSSFTGLTTAVGGGGGGGGSNGDLIANGIAGGSGGGARGSGGTGGTATSGQGNAGGSSTSAYFGAGGGGAGAVGSNATNSVSGSGGIGTSSYSAWGSVTGLGQTVSGVTYFAGGGSGAADTGGLREGGSGGGGKSGAYISSVTYQPGAGTANTGGGGGGAHNTNGNPTGFGGAGGKGVVIVRYLS